MSDNNEIECASSDEDEDDELVLLIRRYNPPHQPSEKLRERVLKSYNERLFRISRGRKKSIQVRSID